MKIRMTDVVAITDMAQKFNTKLNIKTTYKIAKLFNELEAERKTYDKILNNIFDECVLRDENGKPVPAEVGDGFKLIPEKISECQSRVNEINSLEATINDYKFTLDELDSVELTPQELMSFMSFIVE